MTVISQELLSAWSDPQDRCRCITRQMLLLLKAAFLDPWLKMKALSLLLHWRKKNLEQQLRNRQLLYQNPLRVARKHQQSHLPQKELKESTNFLNCLMTLYSLLKMSSWQLHTSRRLVQKWHDILMSHPPKRTHSIDGRVMDFGSPSLSMWLKVLGYTCHFCSIWESF